MRVVLGLPVFLVVPTLVSASVATELLADHLILNHLSQRAAAIPTAKEQAEWERTQMGQEWTAEREKLAVDPEFLPAALAHTQRVGMRRNDGWHWLPSSSAGG